MILLFSKFRSLIIPLAIILCISFMGLGFYEYGKSTQKTEQVVKEQTTYIATRTNIDAAISKNPPPDAVAARSRLQQRQKH